MNLALSHIKKGVANEYISRNTNAFSMRKNEIVKKYF